MDDRRKELGDGRLGTGDGWLGVLNNSELTGLQAGIGQLATFSKDHR